MNLIQSNSFFCSRIETFKEIKLDILLSERNVYQMDNKDTLKLIYGPTPDSKHAAYLARKLATLCVSLGEHPSIRYQQGSPFARDVAAILNDMLTEFKSSNPAFIPNGDRSDSSRDRGQLLIADRTFDTVSPLMHEYTYQAIANDLLDIDEGVVSYSVQENRGNVEKQAVLNEKDELWMDLKYEHIGSLSNIIKEKMADILENNKTASMANNSGESVSIESMSAAVKQLPEYRQVVSKIGQHLNLTKQCMDKFDANLMEVTVLEQTMSTGHDEDGKEFKGPKLVQQLGEMFENTRLSQLNKIRLLAIFLMTQKAVSGADRMSLIQAASLSGPEQQVLKNFERLGQMMQASQGPGIGGIFTGLFKGKKAAAANEDDDGFAPSRHVCELKGILEDFINGNLSSDRWVQHGPPPPASGESKVASVRTRKFGNANANTTAYTGGRFMVFVAGGVCYSEIR